MSNSERQPNHDTGPSRPKKAVERALDDAGLSTDRFIALHPGTKTPAQKWREDGLGRLADAVGEDYGIKCGDGLVVIDVDHPEKLPIDLPPTYTVISPHGDAERAHFYYRVEGPVESARVECGSIQSDASIVVGPGSMLDHEGYCEDGKEDCPGKGTGTYEAIERPIATLDPETIDAITTEATGSSTATEQDFSPPPEDDNDEDAIEEVRGYVRDFLLGEETGPRAREYYSDLLKARYAKRGFSDDRSGAETTLCTLTYGILLDGGADPGRARGLTYQYVTHAARENPFTKEGKIRKWLAGSTDQQRTYRENTLNYAIGNFDREIWDLWRQSGKQTSTNDYCEHAYEVTLDALYELTVEYAMLAKPPTLSTNNTPGNPATEEPETCGYSDREAPYPSMSEIVERAQEEYELTEDSYREILRRIRRDGGAKMARIGSSTYVYYPATYPDPSVACKVKVGGDEYVPEDDPDSIEEESDQTVMTDGGTRTDDTEDDLARTKQTSEDLDSLGRRSPAVFACPIEGCSRIVIDNPGDLRNHVSQESDEAHAGIELDDDLNPVERSSTLDNTPNWGPGKRDIKKEIANNKPKVGWGPVI